MKAVLDAFPCLMETVYLNQLRSQLLAADELARVKSKALDPFLTMIKRFNSTCGFQKGCETLSAGQRSELARNVPETMPLNP